MPAYYLYYLTGIILLPGFLIALWAQTKVTRTYREFSNVFSQKGVTARQMAEAVIRRADLNISVTNVPGVMTDYYDHKKGVIGLSDGVYASSSISALGIAAHELGHALQYKTNYFFIRLRAFLVPVVNISSRLMWPLVLIGFIFGLASPEAYIGSFPIGSVIIISGLIFYGMSVLISLITLPAEFNASSRAIKLLTDSGILEREEIDGARKVLNAAALTYVAALLISFLELFRFLAIIFLSNKRSRK